VKENKAIDTLAGLEAGKKSPLDRLTTTALKYIFLIDKLQA